ncbi:hypothetical protein [Actinoallomurus rhizosphaericola]|uniref:hypothetical protein n=1 Tax=Actinoallomurus rhizosphaericola TaxID=2952536 RepID=UPI0020933FA6|nr:hypothetical protein [Actinoallomurus rhizosphaericola]MCO5996140.1 hypothetical protein [Actinoallomurus rhizosphaericola]
MSAPPPPGDRTRPRLRVTAATLGAFGLVIAVVAVFGGLRAQSHAPAKGGPGKTFDQGLFTVDVLDARTGHDKNAFGGGRTKVLAVRMRVAVKDVRSHSVFEFLEGVMAEPKPGSYVAADNELTTGLIGGQKTSEIHPRLPIEVRAVWKIPETSAPTTVTVALRQWVYKHGFFDSAYYWYAGKDSSYAAKVGVSVQAGGS